MVSSRLQVSIIALSLIGLGIDIGSGQTIAAVQHSAVIAQHPDTGIGFHQLEVPYWPRVLSLAAGCAGMTGLGYLGADIVLDRLRGPMLLELNARPGLAIQVANQAGLRHRLAEAAEIADSTEHQEQKISLARKQFSQSSQVAGQLALDIN